MIITISFYNACSNNISNAVCHYTSHHHLLQWSSVTSLASVSSMLELKLKECPVLKGTLIVDVVVLGIVFCCCLFECGVVGSSFNRHQEVRGH